MASSSSGNRALVVGIACTHAVHGVCRFAAVTTASVPKCPCRFAPTNLSFLVCVCPHQVGHAKPDKKLLRSLSGLGGVSDRTLAKQLAWIRAHPAVLEMPISASQLQKASLSSLKETVGTVRVDIADAAEDWTLLSLRLVVPWLCQESPNFRGLMRDMIQQSGLRHHTCKRALLIYNREMSGNYRFCS